MMSDMVIAEHPTKEELRGIAHMAIDEIFDNPVFLIGRGFAVFKGEDGEVEVAVLGDNTENK